MAKGEIARFEQFLLLSQCFKKPSAAEASESVPFLYPELSMFINLNHNKGRPFIVIYCRMVTVDHTLGPFDGLIQISVQPHLSMFMNLNCNKGRPFIVIGPSIPE